MGNEWNKVVPSLKVYTLSKINTCTFQFQRRKVLLSVRRLESQRRRSTELRGLMVKWVKRTGRPKRRSIRRSNLMRKVRNEKYSIVYFVTLQFFSSSCGGTRKGEKEEAPTSGRRGAW